jgi:hypothetical protein
MTTRVQSQSTLTCCSYVKAGTTADLADEDVVPLSISLSVR